jgi:SAM-dependent methyltransferase
VHGALYHLFYDPPLAEARRKAVEAAPGSSRVLDVACGTGQLCFELAERKGCRVVGVDLSPRMIGFARKRNRHPDVSFELADATGLSRFEPDSFDAATILFLLHEVPGDVRVAVLAEALRLAPMVVVVDSIAPLPWNLHGLALRTVEAIGGPGHYRAFSGFLAAGGIGGVLEDSRMLHAVVAEHSVFWHGCRDITILERLPVTSCRGD